MDAWWQCEVPYPFVPQEVLNATDSVRASLPNRYCDPKVAADLFEEVIDEFLLCDDLGLNVLAVEHHAGINSLLGANPLLVGILARQTRQARILSLGTLISLRKDPVRVAEEYATADVISRGRLEIGFVKSGGTEMASNHANPVNNIERYWEAIDLIKKALSHHDGPFSWEGKHFTHRHVNIWPRPWQQPHPRMWSATGDPETAAEVGRRGMVHVLVLRGPDGTRRAYAAHRKAREEAGLPKVTTDNFAYAAFVYVGDTDEEGLRVGSKLLWFLHTSLKSAPQYSRFLPGGAPPSAAPGRQGGVLHPAQAGLTGPRQGRVHRRRDPRVRTLLHAREHPRRLRGLPRRRHHRLRDGQERLRSRQQDHAPRARDRRRPEPYRQVLRLREGLVDLRQELEGLHCLHEPSRLLPILTQRAG